MRELATVREISAILPIENADAIELAIVDGWQSVVKKGEFSVGDPICYIEIDAWVPHSLAPFLSKGKEPREYNGVKGERLRTIKLRGTLSQGLIIRYADAFVVDMESGGYGVKEFEVGTDVTEFLGIQKWEKPMSAQLRGMARGNFPLEIPKTDQPRIQNLSRNWEQLMQHTWQVTEKLHGSSATFYLDKDGVFHVCSRNIDLKESEDNSYWKLARKLGIEQIMRDVGMQGVAIQGEMIGAGINGNQYGVDLDFYVFDIYDVNAGKYRLPMEVEYITAHLGIKHVPVVKIGYKIGTNTVQDILQSAEGASYINSSNREGLVFKSSTHPDMSFKAVSNSWLLAGGEDQ